MAFIIQKTPDGVNGYAYAVLAVVMICLTWMAYLARLAARHSVAALGADDFLMGLTQLAMTVFSIAALGMHHASPGQHPVTPELQKEAVNWLIVSGASFSLGMVFLKLSLGAFFLRLIHRTLTRQIVYVLMTMAAIINFYMFWLTIFACGARLDGFMMKSLLNQCVPVSVLKASGYTQGAVNTFTDISFALLPYVLLRKSQLPKSIKLYVGGLLVLATVGCIASIVRFWYIRTLFSKSIDFYAQTAILGIVGLVELGVGIIAGSICTLRPLFKTCLGHTPTMQRDSFIEVTTRSNSDNKTQQTHDKSFISTC